MRDQDIDLHAYLLLVKKWWWIAVIGVLVSAATAYFYSSTVTPTYHASVKVLAQGTQSPGLPTVNDFQIGEQIATTSLDLIKTRNNLNQVIALLGLPGGPKDIANQVEVGTSRNTIVIGATDTNPVRAADIANAVAQVFIEDFRRRQFTQIAQFQAALAQYDIEDDGSIVAAQAATLSGLEIVEEAVPSTIPVSPKTRFNMMVAGALGLLIAGLGVFLIEYLDDRIRTSEQLTQFSGMTVLGAVPRFGSKSNGNKLVGMDGMGEGPVNAPYDFVQTSLEFAALGTNGLGALLITSSAPGEGKTTTAANLAITMARAGKQVILVDADLRKPKVGSLFDLHLEAGLSSVLIGKALLEDSLVSVGVPNLSILPSGPIPPDPTVPLRSPQMTELVAKLKAQSDIVIFDSPPVLVATDSTLLKSLTDGVLIVVDAQTTTRKAIRDAMNIIEQGTGNVFGAILNKVSARSDAGYYNYYHSYKTELSKSSNGSGKWASPRNAIRALLRK